MTDDSGWFSMKRRSLLKELQNILREYHDPVQILHELVQNAEDAKASILKITYDKRDFDPGGTLGKYLKSPALCVYNDGVLDDDDWDGITSVCFSHKEDKVDKIGRYGQGFKSVFHLTDYPVVVSGEWMLLIDPFRESKECNRSKLTDSGREIEASRMLNIFGLTVKCIKDGFYPGTLFWFSLRSKGNILSNSEWSPDKMKKIIQLFEEDASLVLLFLKFLNQIRLYKFGQTQSYMSIEFNFDSNEQTRYDLKTMWSSIGKQFTGKTDIVANAEVCLTSHKQQRKQAWTVAHYLANSLELKEPLATLAKDKEIACLPYVGIAYQRDDVKKSTGRIFNFLPLPSATATLLPVHVNGNFTLSQNRRNLKLSDGRIDDKFVEWNEKLVEELLSKAYIGVVLHLIKQAESCRNTNNMVQIVYGCFPEKAKYDKIWKHFVAAFYEKLIEFPVFYTDLRNGTWVTSREAVVCETRDLHISTTESGQQTQIEKTVKSILLQLNKAVVEVHPNMKYLVKRGNVINITSNEIITLLKNHPEVYVNLGRHIKIDLLQYLMKGTFRDFSGLKLLPLHSHDFETFSNESSKVFICNEKDANLFPGLEHKFVSTKLPKSLHDELIKFSDSNKFQLRNLKKEDIPNLLINVFKKYCQCTNGVYILQQQKIPLNTKWIKGVWRMIFRFQEYPSDLSPYEEVPLIPQLRTDNTRLVKSFHVLKGDYVLEKAADQRSLPPEIIALLKTDGIRVLEENEVIRSNKIVGIDNYVKCASLEGIMELCRCRPALKENIQSYVGLSGNIWSPRHTKAISFGQEEKLVTRLKGILYGYPEDHSVLKEILQNADDAGASEVHFVYDMRHHSTKRIFNSTWTPLQGPALCVFNDACFTSSDLEGIKHLGIGSKSEDNTKTGQFGLGFNSVYHLTDAPMIMSKGATAALKGLFVVLDPHCQYAPEAKLYGPGMLMPLQELCTDYPDVFNTFLSSNELKRDEGTWFRFPLRTEDMARTSEIRKETCDIEPLLRNLKKEIQECLLFLLNVRKICVSVIDLKSKFNVESQVYVTHHDTTHFRLFQKSFKEYNEIMNRTPLKLNSLEIREFKYFIDISNHTGVISKWLIVQTLGFSKPKELDHRLQKSLLEKQTVIIPRGGVALRISASDRVVGIRPRVFCLLPLEIETGLTCHINGQFTVDMSRNKLWGSDVENTNDIHGIWNYELIRLNISYAYAECISYLTTCMFNEGELLTSLQMYFKSIPLFSHANGVFWKDLVFQLFLQIKVRRLRVFPVHPHLSTGINNNIDILGEDIKNDELLYARYESDEMPVLVDALNTHMPSENANYNMEILGEDKGNNKLFWVARHSLDETAVVIDALNTQMSLEDANKFRSLFVDLGMKISFTPSVIQESIVQCCKYHHSRNNLLCMDSFLDHKHNSETCVCINSISPETAIAFFKSYNCSYENRFETGRIKPVEHVQMCLRYCLQTALWEHLCGVPLLLSESGGITQFRLDNSLILSRFFYLLPQSADIFVHRLLVDILLPYKKHFKKLTSTKFVELLPFSKSQTEFKLGKIVPYAKTDELMQFFQGVWRFIDCKCSIIDELNEWCFLPVFWKNQTFVFPLKYCQYTIDYDSFSKDSELLSILVRINLPRPDVQSTILSTVVATYENRYATLNCLHKWRDNIDESTQLNVGDCLNLLKYLSLDISVKQTKQICKLKALKLYTSLFDKTISLTGKTVLVFNGNVRMPKDGLENLFCFLRIDVIVDFQEIWASMVYELLGCERTDEVKIYLKYILPNLQLIVEHYRFFHLKFVKDFLLNDLYVARALQSYKLISIGQGLQKGSDFYDPEHELFAIICIQTEFPPSPFCDPTWRRFMIHAGMRTKLSEEVLLCFAKRAAYQTINHQQLVVAFVDFVDTRTVDDSFLDTMASIPFVPVGRHELEYEKIHRSFDPHKKFITYAGSNSHENIHLLWTSANVLPKYAMPRNKHTRSRLKIVLEPDFNQVVTHLRTICYELVKMCTLHNEKILAEVMTSIYDFLSSGCEDVSCLKDLPLIHVSAHKMFAKVNQVVDHLSEEDEIEPFLVKAPTEYGQFFKLFHALGMNCEPTTNNYATVLEYLCKSVAERVLSQNELNLVRKALKGLMKSLQNLPEPINELDVDVLFLLSDENKLKPSTELYYDSLEIPRDRLEGITNISFIADMNCIGYNVSELHEILSYLPKENRPISVSLIVKEEIKFSDIIENQAVSSLRTCLTSDSFISAVLRIIKHDQLLLRHEINSKEMEIIIAKLRRLRIITVSHLETFFVNQSESMSIPKIKSCVLDETNEILYINDNNMAIDAWLQSCDLELERILKVVCCGKFKTGSLLTFLFCIHSQTKNIHDRLTSIGIPCLEDKERSSIWYPLPGSFVPQDLLCFIQKVSSVISVKGYAVILNESEHAYIYVIVTGYDSVSMVYSLNNGASHDIKVSENYLYEIKTLSNGDDENENQEENMDEIYGLPLNDDAHGNDTVISSRIHHSSGKPNPQVSTGRQWLNQAIYDLKIGLSTIEAIDLDEVKGYNWVCMHSQQTAEKAIKGAIHATDVDKFITSHSFSDNIPKGDATLEDLAQKLELFIFQAAEKAIKGAIYSVDAYQFEMSHSLMDNIPRGDSTLNDLAQNLQDVIIHINRLRYPDSCLPCLPADKYSKDDAEKALELSNEILEHVKSKYFSDHM